MRIPGLFPGYSHMADMPWKIPRRGNLLPITFNFIIFIKPERSWFHIMKKKLLIVGVIAVLCFATLATIAYFTAEKTTTNVISTGTVDLELYEKDAAGNVYDEGGMTITNVMPGTEVTKEVYLYNKGTANLYTRARAVITVTSASGATLSAAPVSVTPGDDWTAKDGWYYYNAALAPAAHDNAITFFEEVVIAGSMPNEYQGCTIHVDVEAQAVQVKNNGSSALTAAGWPAE